MQRVLSTVVALAWGLWFGGIMTVFLTVTSLFQTFHDQRPLAGAAAAGVFARFEAMQLTLAAVGVAAALALWATRRSGARAAVASLLGLAAVGAVVSTFVLTARIQDMRSRGVPSASPEFRSTHRASSMVYVAQAGLLLVAGILLPAAITPAAPRTSPGSAPA